MLLTAMPVNNSLWDLYYLMTLFVGHDAAFADRGILSLKERFSDASREDPDTLYDVLDTVTVRRTRHFVRRYYPNDRVRGPDGREIQVQFPDPHVEALNYSLDEVLPGFFEELKDALALEEEGQEPLLTMARYCPSAYRLDQEVEQSQVQLVGLIRSGLLKRFESSAYAFARTAATMADGHDAFLAALDAGRILTPEALEEWTNIDSDEEWENLLERTGEEYRQELRKGLQARGEAIKSLAWGAGSGLAGGTRRGHFFCARVGERVFLRFVPADDGEIVRHTLSCLRLIACAADTARHLPDDLRAAAYDAWAAARQDVYDEWILATDPANLQPRIRPFFRRVAGHLRSYPPSELRQNELDLLVECVEAPWGVRYERALRDVFDPEAADPYEVSNAVARGRQFRRTSKL